MPEDADSPLRVAVLARSVYPLHGYGGLERHVGDLVRHLTRRGLHVLLLTRPFRRERGGPREPEIDRFLTLRELEVHCVPYRTFPFAGRRGTTVLDRSSAYLWFGRTTGRAAAALVASGRIDIVHGLGASALGYARRRRRRRRDGRAPLVFNPQGLEEFGATGARSLSVRLKRVGYRPLQAAVRACAAAADCVIATDRAIVPAVRSYLRVEPARIAVVPNAIDLESLDCWRKQQRIETRAQSQRLLLSVGRLEQNKGFHVLVEALARLTDRVDWRAVIVGDGPYRKRIEALIGAHRLNDRIRLTGRVADAQLHQWYAAADLFVHPTLYEGSSLVTLEAMAHAKAVVATRAGGLPDKVIPGTTGWLVEPADPRALAKSIGEALDHGSLANLGMAGRALVERTFSWTVVAQQTEDLYRGLLQ